MTVIAIPTPPGVNRVRRYDWANHNLYKSWRVEAGLLLNTQHPSHVPGAVKLNLAIEDAGRFDLDAPLKQVIDLLVGHGVIEDDNRRIVRDIRLYWSADVRGCRVKVEKVG